MADLQSAALATWLQRPINEQDPCYGPYNVTQQNRKPKRIDLNGQGVWVVEQGCNCSLKQ